MNHAYADGSQQGDIGGWGVVLIVPGQADTHLCGLAQVEDNGACELIAVLEAVRRAPAGQPLTIHTDATVVVQAIRRGTLHPHQNELGQEIRELAHARGIPLRVMLGPREGRRMRQAHQLATDARLGVPQSLPAERQHVRVRVRDLAWGSEATLTYRRGGRTRRVQVPLPAREGVPPAVIALAALVSLAEPGEHLTVRMDSALAPTLWREPAHAAHGAAQAVIGAARADAEARGVSVEFE